MAQPTEPPAPDPSPEADDEALSWAGDELSSPARPASPEERPLPAAGDGLPGDAEGLEPSQERGIGSLALLMIGILLGVMLLETIGWVVGVSRASGLYLAVADSSGVLGGAIFWAVVVFAVAAPALWTLAAWRLSKGSAGRFAAWVIVGAILLIPVPALIDVAAVTS